MNDILQAYGVTRRVRKPKKEEDQTDPLTPDQEESLVGKLGRNAMGTVGAVGNLLDLPGSMVRDAVSMKNPLDQLLTPFSDVNRVTGRDLNRSVGLAGSQDTWGNFGGGMATEIALDPLTYLTFGASALGKGGQVAKAAGLMPKAAQTYAKKMKRAVAGTADPTFKDIFNKAGNVGPREARAGSTLRDLVDAGGPDALQAAQNAARGKGLDLNSLMDEKLGGSVGIGLPFMDPLFTLGGTKAGKLIDDVGAAVRYAKVPGTDFAPLHELGRLFSHKARDMSTPAGIDMATRGFDAKTEIRAKAGAELARLANELEQVGLADKAGGRHLRRMMEVESARATATPEQIPILDRLRDRLDRIPRESKLWGVPLQELVDEKFNTNYFPRDLTSDIEGTIPPKAKANNARHNAQLPRMEFLKGIEQGTNPIIDLGENQQLNDLLDNGGSRKDVAKAIESLFGKDLTATYDYTIKSGKDRGTVVQRNRYKALASWLGKLSPEMRKSGIFGNHAALDYHARIIAADDAISASQKLVEALSEPGRLGMKTDAAYQRGVITVSDLIDRTGLVWGDKHGGVGYQLALADGTDISLLSDAAANRVLKKFKEFTVDEKYGQDITRYVEGFTAPEAATKILDFVDGLSNFWKGSMTTPWPAFQVRNLVSGQWDNVVAGEWSPWSVNAAKDAVRGKAIQGASQIPLAQQEAARRGMQNINDAQATQILGELAFGYNVVGKFDATNAGSVAGKVQDRVSHDLQDTISGVPDVGRKSFSAKRTAKKFIGREDGTNLNPIAFRGVGGRMKSEFGPMAAGEELGNAVEFMNRFAPWINQLKRGVDPAEAAAKVGAVQVLYQNRYYSKFEQDKLLRAFPFYKFTRKKLPYILSQIVEHPGGSLAQTIRTMENAHDPATFTPDHVTESAAIPVKGTPFEAITGQVPEGHDRYISGLGLSIENPLGYGPGLRGAGLEVMSQLNPFIKAPLEFATGQTFFQKTPTGGRPLGDLDPMTGRLLGNLMGSDTAVKYPGGGAVDFAVGNSPLSRVVGTANMLTDQRRGLPEKLLNVLTGIKTKDVSPAAKDSLERDMLSRAMKQYDAKSFTRTYIPDDAKAKMSPEELAQATQLEQLMDLLAKRAKDRKEAKAK